MPLSGPASREIPWGRPREESTRRTEAGAADAFAAAHGDEVRFNHRRGHWLIFQGHRWVPDDNGAHIRLALAFVRQQQHHALDLTDSFERQDAIEHWARFDRLAMLTNLLTLARNLEPIADAGKDWDADPWLLGTPSGVVDLKAGTLRPGRPADRITRSTTAGFDPLASCPRWEQFIADVFDHDESMMRFIHRALGYSLTGDTQEQTLFLGHGKGSNGKSTMYRTVGTVMGDYSAVMPFATIEMNQRGIPNDLAALDGPRFAQSSETNEGTRINESRVKALSGCDPISARFLYGELFTFRPVMKIWLAVNHLPIVRDDSHSFWRRIRQVPFTRTFPVTPGLEDELMSEAPGILAWLVRGCLLWLAEGLQVPAAVATATDAYRTASDVLADFLREGCDMSAGAEVGASDLYQHYTSWASRAGMTERERLTMTKFGTKMAERFQRTHSRHGKAYQGVARRVL